jgi:cytochrome c oxidase subunit 2
VNDRRLLPASRYLLGGILALIAGVAGADELNMTPGVTEISRSIYDLHMYIFWICVVIGVVVFGAMFWSLVHHRKSAGAEAAQFHESTRLEIAWTLVPSLILIAIAWPATQTLIAMYDTGGEDLTIEVRGYQWKWQYKYLDDDYNSTFGFFSNLRTPQDEIQGRSAKGEFYLLEVDEPLRIPTNRKVRFLITSEDVIHAWWVPDFGIKRDAIPGILNDLWTIVPEPGIYRGQCTELCGKDHGFMPVVVHAMEEAEYDAWYTERLAAEEARQEALSKTFTPEELMAEGEQVYSTYCASCHMPNGKGVPPVFPALDGSAIATGPREDHLDIIVNGKYGTAMQAFGRQLDAAQIAAVTHYERHAWTNNTGDVTQPRDVIEFMSSEE